MERFDLAIVCVFEDYSVSVGGDSLFGRRVKVISSRIIFVGWSEGDGVLLEASEYCPLVHEPGELVSLEDTDSVLDVTDDLLARLLQSEVQVSAPETTVVTIKYLVPLLQRQRLGEVEHGGDLLEVLHPVLDVLLVRGQVGVDEQEGGPE